MKYKGEFWALPKVIFAQKEVSLEARFVYAILWTRANGENVAWPGQKYIAETMGVGQRSVRRYLDELRENGLIEVERQGLNRTNRYHLTGQVDLSGLATIGRSRVDTAVAPPSLREQSKRRDTLAANAAAFSLSKHVNEILSSEKTQPHIRVVVTFMVYKGYHTGGAFAAVKTKPQFEAVISRNVRVASRLAKSYDIADIDGTMQTLSECANFDWNLESVEKYITYAPSKLVEVLQSMRKKVYA